MNFKIIEFNEEVGTLTILINSTNQQFSLDIPIDGDKYLSGDALMTYINGFVPTTLDTRMERIKYGVCNAEEIKKLVTPLKTEKEEEVLVSQSVWENMYRSDALYIQQLVENILREKGIISD